MYWSFTCVKMCVNLTLLNSILILEKYYGTQLFQMIQYQLLLILISLWLIPSHVSPYVTERLGLCVCVCVCAWLFSPLLSLPAGDGCVYVCAVPSSTVTSTRHTKQLLLSWREWAGWEPWLQTLLVLLGVHILSTKLMHKAKYVIMTLTSPTVRATEVYYNHFLSENKFCTIYWGLQHFV